MVIYLGKDADGLIDEEIDDVSHEKHKRLLQTITSTTKRKYLTNSYFISLYIYLYINAGKILDRDLYTSF